MSLEILNLTESSSEQPNVYWPCFEKLVGPGDLQRLLHTDSKNWFWTKTKIEAFGMYDWFSVIISEELFLVSRV